MVPPNDFLPRRGRNATIAVGDLTTFIRDNTRLCAVPHVPEIALYVADEAVPLWLKTEAELGAMGLPMALRLAAAGHRVVGYDVVPAARQRAQGIQVHYQLLLA